jgi:hypothetical protein
MESSRTEAVGTVSASGTVVPESKRRRRSVAERRRVVEQTLAPGASVARVARDHRVNANQVFHWRRLYQRGLLGGKVQPGGGLLPVKVSESAETTAMVARGSGLQLRLLRRRQAPSRLNWRREEYGLKVKQT